MPSSKPVLGVNDLQSQFPEIAAEAYGWDPSTVTKGSSQKKDWECKVGHIYESTVSSRTSRGSGCPVCAGQKVLKGFNDLQTKFPNIAAEAYGWDPTTVTAGTSQKKDWKCSKGHIYCSAVGNRTIQGSGCPICSNKQLLTGFNDLQTKFPDIAAEAYGWDPSTVTAGTDQKKVWKCILGHTWCAQVSSRTSRSLGCPYCSNNIVLLGFNDLQTKFPDIAAEAYGWDPSTVIAGSAKQKNWKCILGHIWNASIANRTRIGSGCPICSNKQLLTGFNDLQTKFPDIAAEAYGWDPSTVIAGSAKQKNWKCIYGHTWNATLNIRTVQDTGCPICAEYGFNPGKDAWFYLMERTGEQQLGVTNDLPTRLKTHERNGWNLVEHTSVPSRGQKVLDTEKAFKKWLKKEIGLIKGTTENWSTISMEVQSLAELKARSGIETDLF